MSRLQRLSMRIHPGLSLDALPQEALQINDMGMPTIIVVKDGLMSIQNTGVVVMANLTVSDLAQHINDISNNNLMAMVAMNSGSMGGMTENVGKISSLALIEGVYMTPCMIPVFTSHLWHIGTTVDRSLARAQSDWDGAYFQWDPHTATGMWLDSLGVLYGVQRQHGEPDTLYSLRIFNFSMAPKLNGVAIQKILNDLGYKSTISEGSLSFTIRLILSQTPTSGQFTYDNNVLLSLINNLRAAGVSASIILQSTLSDSMGLSDSVTASVANKNWTVGNVTVGQFNV